jgi:hypothetical protein
VAARDLGSIAFEADVADVFAKERWLLRQEGGLVDDDSGISGPPSLSYEVSVQEPDYSGSDPG